MHAWSLRIEAFVLQLCILKLLSTSGSEKQGSVVLHRLSGPLPLTCNLRMGGITMGGGAHRSGGGRGCAVPCVPAIQLIVGLELA